MRHVFLHISLVFLFAAAAGANPAGPHGATEIMTNVFHSYCIDCHGKWKQEAGLDLRTHESILAGGDSGPVLIPGKPDESPVYLRLLANEMPPAKNLHGDKNYSYRPRAEDVEQLRGWIAAGALPAQTPTDAGTSGWIPDEDDADYWAFRVPRRPEIPEVEGADQVRTPVDAFLLRRLEEKGLSYALEADRRILLRRACFDLIGLPPTPEELDAWLVDKRPDAYELLIDRLLASPRYGERWGTYWLDAAGYGDTQGTGGGRDEYLPYMWRYRDYVIRSYDADKPYDQFLVEQIAGDELVDYASLESLTPDQIDNLVATGFLRTAADGTDERANYRIKFRQHVLNKQIDIVSTCVMGVALECARCHDHKFDPITQRDYYSFTAIFRTAYDLYDWRIPNSFRFPGRIAVADRYQRDLSLATDQVSPELARYNSPFNETIARCQAELEQKLAGKAEAQLSEELKNEVATLRAEIGAAQGQLLEDLRIHALVDLGGEPLPVHVFRRGDLRKPAEQVLPGVPVVFQRGLVPYKIIKPDAKTDTSGNRLALARWLVQPDHPLTARVMINRIWQHHFGRGLVTTPGNLGSSGERPSHPQLLDWLATEFVRRNWSVKSIHRLIMTSAVYRQRSSLAPAEEADDRMLSHFPLRRLDAEALRDAVLYVSGRLDPAPNGPADEVDIAPDGEVTSRSSAAGSRRSIYVTRRNDSPTTMLELFDAPRRIPNCLQRTETTVPTQALFLWNSKLVRNLSMAFAERVRSDVGDDRDRQIEHVYRLALARRPTADELDRDRTVIIALATRWREHDPASDPSPRRRALMTYCHTVLNSPEFMYLD